METLPWEWYQRGMRSGRIAGGTLLRDSEQLIEGFQVAVRAALGASL